MKKLLEIAKMKRRAALLTIPVASLCLAACSSNQTPSLGQGATNNGNNSTSISQGSGNTGVQSGRNASGYGTNTPYSQGTSGNQMSANGLPISK